MDGLLYSVRARLNLVDKKLDQTGQLLLVQDDSKGTHGERSRLADLWRVRSGQLRIDCIHKSLLVHKVLLSLNQKTKLLEHLCADLQTFPCHILVLRVNSINQSLIDLLNNCGSTLILAFGDNTTHCESIDVCSLD